MLNDVSDDFEAALLAALPSDVIKEIEPRYLEEPRGRYAGQTTLMAVPQTVEQVATIVRPRTKRASALCPMAVVQGWSAGRLRLMAPARLFYH